MARMQTMSVLVTPGLLAPFTTYLKEHNILSCVYQERKIGVEVDVYPNGNLDRQTVLQWLSDNNLI